MLFYVHAFNEWIMNIKVAIATRRTFAVVHKLTNLFVPYSYIITPLAIASYCICAWQKKLIL